MAELRSTEQRKADVLAALENNGSAWLATAGAAGEPRLIAVSFWWDGSHIVLATRVGNPTAHNLVASRKARLGIGSPDDVIMVDAALIDQAPAASAKSDIRKGFISAAGWDPAEEGDDWAFFRLQPVRIEAYRGYAELEGRTVMRQSRWLV
jgi:hypothetical protein